MKYTPSSPASESHHLPCSSVDGIQTVSGLFRRDEGQYVGAGTCGHHMALLIYPSKSNLRS